MERLLKQFCITLARASTAYMVGFNFCKQLLFKDSFHGRSSQPHVKNDVNISIERISTKLLSHI
ncbi:hypothetical protein Fmac_016854 [Flemingia macrophylla]|uniref:Uncharacterized protein n=1 Tax=Flemingia macrophylla TaxID=520843 RepID=A0ABD1MIT8_9FABA